MPTDRKDGKVTVSCRIPLEVERALHRHCALSDDRVSKSEIVTKALVDYLQLMQVGTTKEEC